MMVAAHPGIANTKKQEGILNSDTLANFLSIVAVCEVVGRPETAPILKS